MHASKSLVTAIVGALAFCAASLANAQGFPTKTIRVVVPWPPAGIVDVAGRVIAERAQAELGQPMIIENKPGAGGMIGADLVAKSGMPQSRVAFCY